MDPQVIDNQVVTPVKKKRRLTVKQRKFVKGVLMGKSGTQAALEAYNTDDVTVAHSIASENLSKPSIQEALDLALSADDLSLPRITGNLSKLANLDPEKVSGDTVLKANIEILKLHNAYPGQKHTHLNLNVNAKVKDMTFDEAKEALNKLRSGNDSILQDVNE